MRQVYIEDGRVADFATCDDCEVEQPPDEMIRVERHGCADSYRCEDCNTRRGEAHDGRLWAQVDIQRIADND